MFFNALASGLAHTRRQGFIAQQTDDQFRQAMRRFDRNEETGFLIDDRLAVAADVGGNHRTFRGHVFDKRIGKTFAERG